MTRPLSGIYKITCTANGKMYVGQAQNVYDRRTQHFTRLQHQTHKNAEMLADFNQFGRAYFTFEIIEWCELDKLNEREKYWIETLGTEKPHGYNGPWVKYNNPRSEGCTGYKFVGYGKGKRH